MTGSTLSSLYLFPQKLAAGRRTVWHGTALDGLVWHGTAQSQVRRVPRGRH